MRERRIIKRPNASQRDRPQWEREIPPQLESLVDQAILRNKELAEEHGITTVFQAPFHKDKRYIALELYLKDPQHQYFIQLTTVRIRNLPPELLESDFTRTGEPSSRVLDVIEPITRTREGKTAIRTTNRYVFDATGRMIRQLTDDEAVSLMRDVLDADVDHEKTAEHLASRQRGAGIGLLLSASSNKKA